MVYARFQWSRTWPTWVTGAGLRDQAFGLPFCDCAEDVPIACRRTFCRVPVLVGVSSKPVATTVSIYVSIIMYYRRKTQMTQLAGERWLEGDFGHPAKQVECRCQ